MQKKVLIRDVTGVILAGGKSSRFGVNKALMEINGFRLIDRVTGLLSSIFEQVILIANSPEEYSYLGLPIRKDLIRGLGPIGGILTGLEEIQDEAGFFIACDMPFISEDLIRYIVSGRGEFDAVVPKIDWKIEPLHALYRKSCLPVIRDSIASGVYQIVKTFDRLNVRYLNEAEIRANDPQMRSFFNVNRPEELVDSLKRIKEEKSV
ncbi:MAG TPA: molybdenum cofactor guanylyltransferase [Desulfatiglandales bacterium]|nr:molybdenum cofactor guanylyltransferase [Desulfatiglandales bacterium]